MNKEGEGVKKPVIIDCDPGIDDAVAIFMALASDELDVRAITPVAGNQTLEKTSRNALKIVDFLEKKVKVARGADRPLTRDLVIAEYVHGESGTGSVVFPEGSSTFYEKNAFDTIYEEAMKCDGKLQIIALGPLTNIAITLIKYPQIKDKIERITLMGGSSTIGNVTPAAEFNIYVDPEAAKIVYESGIPITTVALDVTLKAIFTVDEMNELIESKGRISQKAGEMVRYINDIGIKFGHEGGAMHDPLAVAWVINPDVMNTKSYRLDVETNSEFTDGKTVVDIYNVTNKTPNTDFGVEIDRVKFVNMAKDLMMSYDV